MTDHEPRQYGNFRRPMTAGLGKLNLGHSLALIGQMVVGVVLVMMTGSILVIAAVTLYMLTFAALLLFPDRHGITPMQHLTERISFMRRKRKGLNVYQAASREDGHTPPPGILAGVRLTEHRDGHGRPYVVVHFLNGQAAVVLRCHPVGGELHDQDTVDGMVAAWGGFEAALAATPGVDQVATTVDVGPNYGASSLAAVEDQMDPDANALARRINRDTALLGAQSKTSATVYVAVTFRPARGKGTDMRDEMVASDIARRLPGMIQRLKYAGAGSVTPCKAQDITEAVRIAYDPGMARTLESAKVSGNAVSIRWEDCGPTFHEAHGQAYQHDSAVSATFKMTVGPRGTITSDSLRLLIGPHQDIHRKRVTLIRHIVDAGRAADIAELGFNNARVRAEAPRASASARTDYRIAEAVRNEQTTGAALVDFTMLITVTVLDPDKLPDAVVAIEDYLGPSARIEARIMYGVQDLMFAAALPLGVDLRAHRAASLTRIIK